MPAPEERKILTKPSDLELYERRQDHDFADDETLCAYLLPQASPKEQVMQASLYDFFRTVCFHGGKNPHYSWHDPKDMPIVMMSPMVKLRECPDFAFGARWALMQYHAWSDRRWFLDMDDDAVRVFFRNWVENGESPWYIEEEYLQEDNKPIRKPSQPRGAKVSPEAKDADAEVGACGDSGYSDEGDGGSETECSEEGQAEEVDADTKVFKMLYRGDIAQVSRQEARLRKGGIFNNKHGFYKRTRCTSTAQEEYSALPAGVINVCEDTDDEGE